MKPSLSLSFHLNRWFIIVSILLLLFAQTTIIPSLANAVAAQDGKETSTSQSTETKDTKKISHRDLAQLTPKTTELAKKLLDMQNQLNAITISDHTEQQLAALSEQEGSLEEEIVALESDPKISRLQLTDLQIKL